MNHFRPKVKKAKIGWFATTGLEHCGRWPPHTQKIWRPTRQGVIAAAQRINARFMRGLDKRNQKWQQT